MPSPEPSLEKRLRAVRAYTKWSLLLSVQVFAGLPLFVVAFADVDWWRVPLVAMQLVFMVLVGRLTLRGMSEYGCVRPSDPQLLITLGLSLASCAAMVSIVNIGVSAWAAFSPAAAASAAAAVLPSPLRWVQSAIMAGLTSLITVVQPNYYWLTAAIVVVMITGVTVTQAWLWDVTEQVNAARATESELAVANERLRFAADLHDVLGHSLEVIAMKAELAVRLPDDERARATMAEVRQTAHDALSEVRDVVRGYRRVDLSTELGGIRSLLEAAGITCGITGSLPSAQQPLFGAVLREAVTNVLRHAAATRCEITFDGPRVTVVNDGVADSAQDGTGTGLTGLAARVHAVGGRFTAGAEPGGTFRVSAEIPEEKP
ncbi:sensor histidine kinase [Allokutzneria albata]|uniref:Two-component system, NarL family, sensor histidine kinase DesK n=1 Tax=Allokutzneria albata TaxID=211114 RepID=A0A1G9ZCA3_ALLAB|nr:histidine kinase [Allokutzneria albata]SDN18113.1 two-component system, NarL family, sensor histidine kinase DesK [Allokutzneria albata]